MDFQNQAQNPHNPRNWPYGLPLDPKYLYLSYPKPGLGSYEPDRSGEDYPGQSTGPLDDLGIEGLLAQRADLVDYRVQMIVEEIKERRRILERNIYSIDLDQCAHRDIILFRSEDIWDKYRFKLEQEILNLEENKRREESSYFRDILFLKKELRDSLIERKEEDLKASLLV